MVSRRRDVAPYLPTLQRARAERMLLPSGTPVERRLLAALVVKVRMARREAWREQVAVSQRRLRGLPTESPTKVLAVDASAERLHRVLGHVAGPGCAGHARGLLGQPACPSCRAVIELDHIRDVRRQLDETYVPREITALPAMHCFEQALEEAIPPEPPEAMRCVDLRPQRAGGAYRSAGASKDPTFFGYRFGDAIEQGREAVDRFLLRGPIVAQRISAYGWPFLWLVYDGADHPRHIVVFADGRGQLRSFVGAEPLES